jgi:hypothetical protein
MEQVHLKEHPDTEFERPSFPRLAALLTEAGFATPKGNTHWWPAQVQQLMEGRFDRYYSDLHDRTSFGKP